MIRLNAVGLAQALRIGNPTLTATGMFAHFLFVFPHDRRHSSNTILKSADDTNIPGLIANQDETVYRDEIRVLSRRGGNIGPSVSANPPR